MRLISTLVIAAVVPLSACNLDLTGLGSPDAPRDLAYQLIPSGDPSAPLGVLLTWTPPSNGYAVSYDVFARDYDGGQWTRRATTTSPSFHDAGIPELQYYVQALDQNGQEMGRTDPITINANEQLPAPAGIRSVSLNGAIQLAWDSLAVFSPFAQFDYYRVYSSTLNTSSGVCSAPWSLEGTTVSDAFLSANLTNGVRRCYAVTAVSRDGHESQWSDVIADTPRWDAKSVLIYASDVRTDSSAFFFYDALAGHYGVVGSDTRFDADVVITRAGDGSLQFSPARSAVTLQMYARQPVADITTIDRAPTSGYASTPLTITPDAGYVFRTQLGGVTHYAAMRVVLATHDYVIIDWSYQSGSNDPELDRTSDARLLTLAP